MAEDIESRLAVVEDWLRKEELQRLESRRPPKPDDVREALCYARSLKAEHEQGKLTDPERVAVVLAKALEQAAALWFHLHRDDPPDELTDYMRRVLRS
jgi:hypothetical protein